MFFMRAMAVSAAALRLSSLSAALRRHRPPLPESCCPASMLPAAGPSGGPCTAEMEPSAAALLDAQGQSVAALSMAGLLWGSSTGEAERPMVSKLE